MLIKICLVEVLIKFNPLLWYYNLVFLFIICIILILYICIYKGGVRCVLSRFFFWQTPHIYFQSKPYLNYASFPTYITCDFLIFYIMPEPITVKKISK